MLEPDLHDLFSLCSKILLAFHSVSGCGRNRCSSISRSVSLRGNRKAFRNLTCAWAHFFAWAKNQISKSQPSHWCCGGIRASTLPQTISKNPLIIRCPETRKHSYRAIQLPPIFISPRHWQGMCSN